MLTIAMVQVSNFAGRGAEYVAKLTDGIRRNLPEGFEHRFVCLTDGSAALPDNVEAKGVPSGLVGYWNKLSLFKPGMFLPGERVLYLDLDTLILGNLIDIVAYHGSFVMLRDFYGPEHLNSSCMMWTAGAYDQIWTRWDQGGRPQFDTRGDQAWIETMQPLADRWQDELPGQFVSYKADCWLQGKIPDGARVLSFHGHPRPHECQAHFVKAIWNRPLTAAA